MGLQTFAADLWPFTVEALDADPSTICALDDALRIVYVNAAWDRFARDNGARWEPGAWGVGSAYLDAISPEQRPFHASLFDRVRVEREPVVHEYDCSSPDTERRHQMRLLRCRSGIVLVVHSPVYEVPRGAQRAAFHETYREDHGYMTRCAHCRRVRRARTPVGAPQTWDWVSEYAGRAPLNTSHALCRVCLALYCRR